MGEARRRKLLGLYPDGSRPKPDIFDGSKSSPSAGRVCALCHEGGGTLVRSGLEEWTHVPNCEYATAQRMRAQERVRSMAAWQEARRRRPAKPAAGVVSNLQPELPVELGEDTDVTDPGTSND